MNRPQPGDTPPGRRRGGLPGGLGWNLVSAALPLVGSFVVSLLVAPYLGPERFGHYVTAMSAATMLLIVGKFGVHSATSRLLSEDEANAGTWMRAGLLLRLAFTLSTALLAWIITPWVAPWLGGEGLVGPFEVVGAVIVSASLLEFAGEAQIGLGRFRAQLGLRAGFLVLRLAAIAWVRLGQLGTVAFLVGHTLAQLLPSLVALAALLRSPSQHTVRLAVAVRRTFQISAPLALSSASFLVYAHTDRLMLARLADPATVGQFGVARNVIDAALFPVFALTWSLRPALVKAARSADAEELQHVMSQGLRASFLYAVAAPALLVVFGPGLLTGLYSMEYREAAHLLLWMAPVLLLRGVGALVFPGLLAADAQNDYARLMVVTALANVVANALLIPRWGAEGAVVATLVALVPLTVGGFGVVHRRLAPLRVRQDLRSHTLAVAVSGGVAWLSHRWMPADAGLPWLLGGAALAAGLVLALTLPVVGRRSA
jgi:O-antigen/teichoic acid export membrane protein